LTLLWTSAAPDGCRRMVFVALVFGANSVRADPDVALMGTTLRTNIDGLFSGTTSNVKHIHNHDWVTLIFRKLDFEFPAGTAIRFAGVRFYYCIVWQKCYRCISCWFIGAFSGIHLDLQAMLPIVLGHYCFDNRQQFDCPGIE